EAGGRRARLPRPGGQRRRVGEAVPARGLRRGASRAGRRPAAARPTCRRASGPPRRSALDHADGLEARDAGRQAGPVHDPHHGVDVLVGVGLLLCQALAAAGQGDHAALLELAAQVAAPRGAHRGVPAEPAPGPVAGRAEAALHRARAADEHPAGPPHVAGHEHRLPDLRVARRELGVAGGERARGALAVHQQPRALAVDDVLLLLGDVVGDVVDELQAQLRPRPAEHGLERLTHLHRQELAVREAEVRRGPHRAQVRLPLGRVDRRAGELPVGQADAVALRHALEPAQVVVADLVAEAARAAVDQYRDVALLEAERRGGPAVLDALDELDLDEVVARAHGAALVGAAPARQLADELRPGAVDAPVGLALLD